jgi:hypothetical protein
MHESQPDRAEIEEAMRCLLRDHDLPEPDEVAPHEDGGIVCLWYDRKVAIIVDPDDPEPGELRAA